MLGEHTIHSDILFFVACPSGSLENARVVWLKQEKTMDNVPIEG